jgi:hypothetical protein
VVYHPPSGSRKKNKAVQKHADARHDLASICHFLYSQRSNIYATIVIDLFRCVVAAVTSKSRFTKYSMVITICHSFTVRHVSDNAQLEFDSFSA